MTRLLIGLALAACAKEPRGEPATQPAPDVRELTLPRGPVPTTPRELFGDFTRPDADSVALADKYAAGATFTAAIKTVGAEEDGSPVVWIDVDGENLMMLDFAEPPAHALRAGEQLTVTCKIAGASGALMMVTECVTAASTGAG